MSHKNKILFISLLSILFMGFKPQPKTRIIFFGDSITYLGTSWEGAYINKMESISIEQGFENLEFINAGISGNKVTDLYLRMKEDVLDYKPDIVVIYIGINDVWHKSSFGTGTDFGGYKKFYDAIVKELQDAGIKVVLATPSVIGERTDFSNECDGDLNLYAQWVRDYASEMDLPLVDLRKAFLEYNLNNNPENKSKGILTKDGVHLSANGNKLVAEEMWKVIRTLF